MNDAELEYVGFWLRVWAAIIENYRNKDGSVTIPTALRPYMRGQQKIEFMSP